MKSILASYLKTAIDVITDNDLDELERLLNEDELSGIERITVYRTRDVQRARTLLERLHLRCGEMKKLRSVNAHVNGDSKELLDSVASIARDCPAPKIFSLGLIHAPLTEKLIQACCAPSVKSVNIEFGAYTKEGMESLCEGLCNRQEPLHSLSFDNVEFDMDAMTIFSSALPRLRLKGLLLGLQCGSVPYVQEEYQRLFKGLAECLEVNRISLKITSDGHQRISFDEVLFSSILESIQCMASLRELRWYGPVEFSTDQWLRLGKTVSKCPYLIELTVEKAGKQAEVDAFLDGCGPHPRLLRLNLGAPSLSIARTERWQTLRARCLTVLLVGNTVQRVGAHSSVYKIPRDIFRRLHSFLPEGERRVRN